MTQGASGRKRVATAPQPLPLPVVDNHTHLDIVRTDAPMPAGSVRQALDQAAAVGVDRVVQVGCDPASARRTHAMVEQYSQVVGAVAVHPNEAPRLAAKGALDEALAEVEALAAHPRIRAISETGLDYFRTGAAGIPVQKEAFRWHIDLAKRLGLPLQIHDRDAHDDVLEILAQEGAPQATIMHCFSGDQAVARRCVDAGYYLSYSGTVTFKSAHALREALAITPLDQLLLETDAPYLTPTPFRGAVNGSFMLPYTARTVAAQLNIDVPALCAAVSETSERLYGPW